MAATLDTFPTMMSGAEIRSPELQEPVLEQASKIRQHVMTGLKVLGVAALIGVSGYAGYTAVKSGAVLWQAMEAGPVLAGLAHAGVEAATHGFDALAQGIAGIREGIELLTNNLTNVDVLSGANADAAAQSAQEMGQAVDLSRDAAEVIQEVTPSPLPNPFGPENLHM